MVLSAVASQIGLFEAEMSSDSYKVLGMMERGYLPKCFGARSRYGTPSVGILLSLLAVMSMLLLDFVQTVQILNAAWQSFWSLLPLFTSASSGPRCTMLTSAPHQSLPLPQSM
jgi:L-asparagine transporter-like permease